MKKKKHLNKQILINILNGYVAKMKMRNKVKIVKISKQSSVCVWGIYMLTEWEQNILSLPKGKEEEEATFKSQATWLLSAGCNPTP